MNEFTIRRWYKHYQQHGEVPAVTKRNIRNKSRKQKNRKQDCKGEGDVRVVRRRKREPWHQQELVVLKKKW
jgi:hypothetical protein